MSNLHPLFEGIFRSMGFPVDAVPIPEVGPPTREQKRMADYVFGLQHMDWGFEWSDDHRSWSRGRDRLVHLRGEQQAIDPTGEVWRQYAPAEYQPIVEKARLS